MANKTIYMFPSPFGVRVLKCDDCRACSRSRPEFPSPFGVRVLKLKGVCHMYLHKIQLFPSPFGVRVLK